VKQETKQITALEEIACFGVSHRTAPVSVREHIQEQIARFMADLPPYITEHALLSTCNRVELYVRTTSAEQAIQLPAMIGQSETPDPYCYLYQGADAAQHLYRVSAGLDSLVLGEPQILGQVRHTAAHAQQNKTAGRALQSLLNHATTVGKRARTETAISHSPASVSSVAINLAHRELNGLAGKTIAIIGLGEMGRLVLKALRHRGLSDILLVNRTRAVAENLSAADSQVIDWADLDVALRQADVLFCATGATLPVITSDRLHQARAQNETKPLIALDLAVPRNIETAVRDIPHVHLFDMDHLHGTLDDALAARQKEVPKVEEIITEEINHLHLSLQQLAIQPLISDLRQQAETIRQRELERTMRHLGENLDPALRKHVEHLSRSLINKMLHQPMSHLRQQAETGEQVDTSAVRQLFGLQE